MKIIKILQITDSKRTGGGSQEHLRILCKGLNKGRFYPFIVCRPGPLAKFYQKQGFEVIPIDLRYHYKAILRLIKIIKEKDISIVHTHNLLADKVGCIAGKLAGVPVVISTLHKLVNISSGKRKYNFPIWLHNHIVKHLTDKIIAVSDAVRKTAIKELKVNPSKVVTIHNAIDISKFQKKVPESEIQNLKKELNIKPNNIVIATIGRLTSGKGYECFLEAISLVLKENNNISFLLIGEGRLKNNLKILSKKLGINEYVRFIGYRQDINRILSVIDIVVSSSLSEGLSMVILESMASKKPVIATNVGGIPEEVLNNQTGLLIPPQSPRILAESLLMLVMDRHKIREMGEAAFCYVKEKFDMPLFVQKTEKLFEDILISKGRIL